MPQSTGNKPPYSDDELAGIIGNMIQNAGDFAQDFLEDNRRKAWAYYLGHRERQEDFSSTTPRTGYTREGASQAVSEDVADMVEALMATLMPTFSSDVPVQFEPIGEGDEENAAAESDAVANVLMERNQGWTVLAEAIKDALLLRNGTIKCWIDEQIFTERRRFKDISDVELASFLAAIPEDSGIEHSITGRDGTKATVKLTRTVRQPRVAAIEQSNFLIDPNHKSIFIQEAHFVAERKFPTRSDLIGEGLPKRKVDKLPAFTNDTDIDSTAKNIEGISADLDRPTHDADIIKTYECYMQIDMDGDGQSELMRFIWSNNVLLDQEPAEFIPYATGTGWLVPHRYSGLSVYDKIRQVTDIKSRALQQYLDNLVTNNTSRTGVDENTVNMDDFLAGRPNAILRNDGPPAQSMMPFPTNDTGQSSQALLNYMDQVRDQRTGAALQLQQRPEIKASITQGALDRQIEPAELQAAMIARTLAETLIRSAFLLLHETLRTQFPEELMLNRSGQWISVSPSDWPQRNRVNVKVGLSPAERNRKAGSLQMTVQQQMQLMQAGGNGVIVGLNEVHRAMLDWSRSVELDNPEKYWIDPESEESKQAAQAASEAAQAEQQAQLQALTAEAQAQGLNATLDRETDKEELQFKYFKELLAAEGRDAELAQRAVQAAELASGSNGAGDTGSS